MKFDQWRAVLERLQYTRREEVVSVVEAIYGANHGNRALVHRLLALPNPKVDAATLARIKEKIACYLVPEIEESFQFESALELLGQSARELGDPEAVVGLYLHALESGNVAIRVYGALFEEFFDVMLDIADRCAEAFEALTEFDPAYRRRLAELVNAAADTGWYQEGLYERFNDHLAETE